MKYSRKRPGFATAKANYDRAKQLVDKGAIHAVVEYDLDVPLSLISTGAPHPVRKSPQRDGPVCHSYAHPAGLSRCRSREYAWTRLESFG